MPLRNQNRAPRSPNSKKEGLSSAPFDKRRKVEAPGTGRRQVLSTVNRQDVTANSDVGSTEEPCKVDFTKDEVVALLNERVKAGKFDTKAKIEQMTEIIKKLKVCLKWFQRADEAHVQEKDDLRSSLEAAEKRFSEKELDAKTKEEELLKIVAEMKENIASLKEKFSKEELAKSNAIESHGREKERRVAAEKGQDSIREEKMALEKKLTSLEVEKESLQKYNTDLQQYNSTLHTDLKAAEKEAARAEKEKSNILAIQTTLRNDNKSLEDQLAVSKVSQDEANKQKESLQSELKRVCDVRDRLQSELKQVQGELKQVGDERDREVVKTQKLTNDILKSSHQLDVLIANLRSVEGKCTEQKELIEHLKKKLAISEEKLEKANESRSHTVTEYEEQKRHVCELQDRLAEAERKLCEGELVRKKLHNTILELKGNIRVFCRVRPLLPEEGGRQEASVIAYPTSTESFRRGIDLVQNGNKQSFTFDEVFDHGASQEKVFFEISQLVQSALDGYKVCIFAYGQTGSGKTYTMMGRSQTPEQKGLIPRSLEQIFQASQSLSTQGWKYTMQVSMLEIYNETLRDLLSKNRSISIESARGDNNGRQYTITHDVDGNTHVSDLTIVDVCSIGHISSLLEKASQSRSVGKTNMNEESSRSHFVFTLRISGVNENTGQKVEGVLNLIDLAGSERLSKSGAEGARLKETQAINKSLSALTTVIFSLAKKEAHVPFRDSKLTYLLQPCLGGNSKTLMFVNISPDPASTGESLNSLKFAARVNDCEIGVPRRQTSTKLLDSRLSYG